MYENEIYSNPETERYTAYQTGGNGAGDGENGGQGSQSGNGGKKAKKKGGFKKVLFSAGLGLMFGAFAGAGFYGVKAGTEYFLPAQERQTSNLKDSLDYTDNFNSGITNVNQVVLGRDDVTGVIEKVMPSMVSILNNYTDKVTMFWGQTYSRQGVSAGSGIIVSKTDKELLIVTNNHVVSGTDDLEVTFIDGSAAKAAIRGTDAEMDLAVLAVQLDSLTEETRNAIAVAEMGDSDDLKVGTYVFAIGNALGYGQTVSDGMIGALDREVAMEDGSTGTFIQTTAAINSGNSGGALFTLDGKVIGINTGKIKDTGVEGMGFAIPISSATPIISQLMERKAGTEKVAEEDRGYMGVGLQSVTQDAVQLYGMPEGAFVYSVEEGSPAEAAGIRKSDVIVRFDGGRISSREDLLKDIEYYKAGDTITVTVERMTDGQYQSLELEITLGNKPQE